MWRSPVAQRSGGPEVASSNLVIPTIRKERMKVHSLHSLYKDAIYGVTRKIHGFIGLVEVHTMAMLYGVIHYGGLCRMDADARQNLGGIAEMVPVYANHSHILVAPVPDGILVEREAGEMAIFGPVHADEIGNNCNLSYVGCLSWNQPAQLPQPTDDPTRVLFGH